jgi:NADH:ubiquinone oxidoreductase subunit 2 (subunit N)
VSVTVLDRAPASAPASSLPVVLAAVLGLWLAPSTPLFLAAWALLFAWATARVAGRPSTPLAPALVLACGVVPVIPLLSRGAPAPLVVLAAAMAAGVVPFHLWLSALERRAPPREFLVVLLGQPGLVWLHRYVTAHGEAFHGATRDVLLGGFVLSALVMTGLGLVRREPRRALAALASSQSMLALAGAVTGERGWAAARLLWISLTSGSAVLHAVVFALERRYDVRRLAQDHGLAAAEPSLHRVFVTMGWLMVGVPGGIAFFAEDLLFHAIVEESALATLAFLLSAALNAAVFYRVYLGLFSGPATRPPRPDAPAETSPGGVAWMLAAVLLVILGGVAPGWFL